MKQKASLSIIKNSVIILSAIVVTGSGYLLITSPTQAMKHPLFNILVVLLVINLVLFLWYKVDNIKAKKDLKSNHKTTHQTRKTKDPKPHSKK